MATVNKKHESNASGKYYVDTDCIACDTCVGIAPKFFKLSQNCDYAYVVQQPKTSADQELCELAIVSCPVTAIGNDGGL